MHLLNTHQGSKWHLYLTKWRFLMLFPIYFSPGMEEKRRPAHEVLQMCDSLLCACLPRSSTRTAQQLHCTLPVVSDCSHGSNLASSHWFQYCDLRFVSGMSLVSSGCWTSDFEPLDHLHWPLYLWHIANFNKFINNMDCTSFSGNTVIKRWPHHSSLTQHNSSSIHYLSLCQLPMEVAHSHK